MNAIARHPCPTCGQPLAEVPLAALLAPLSPAQGRILTLVARAPGIKGPAVVERLGLTGMGTQVARIRERIAPLGWTVEATLGAGGGYRLVRKG